MSQQQSLIKDKQAEVRLKSVKEALAYIKKCPYGGTAIKFELEGQLDREDEDGRYCNDCDGDGTVECMDCTGGGEILDDDAETWSVCNFCDGDGRLDCDTCEGNGYDQSYGGFSEDYECEAYILDHVSQEARDALIFRRFYDDGSVDSEFTFTLQIDKAYLATEFIQAFKALSEQIGNGLDVDGAGMHIAVLNSSNGNYPGGNSLKRSHAVNFRKSMEHLLPAMFFLGSSDHRSRGLNYRSPEINTSRKHSAISGGANEGCYEYRVFETCYDHPERVHDFICVIAKTLQFYKAKAVNCDFFGKIGEFNFRDGRGLSRFYYTRNHLEALRAGLEILKPDYKTVRELYKERNFKVTYKKIEEDDKKRRYQWLEEHRTFISRQKPLAVVQREARAIWEGNLDYKRYYGEFEIFLRDQFLSSRLPENPKDYVDMKQKQFTTNDSGRTITI